MLRDANVHSITPDTLYNTTEEQYNEQYYQQSSVYYQQNDSVLPLPIPQQQQKQIPQQPQKQKQNIQRNDPLLDAFNGEENSTTAYCINNINK